MSGPIVGIGGGGFLLDDARLLQERYLLGLVRGARPRPRVLFLGTAIGDGERAQLKFMQAFTRLGCDPTTLPFFPYHMHRDYVAEALDADLIYVGGGNTVAMLAVWRAFGFDRALRDAWRGGSVLAGISAGANCWFDEFITDSVPGGGIVPGLGWVPGTFCPHVDSEPWRRPMMSVAKRYPVYGAPEGVLMRFEGGELTQCVADRESASALRCDEPGGAVVPTATVALR